MKRVLVVLVNGRYALGAQTSWLGWEGGLARSMCLSSLDGRFGIGSSYSL